MSEAPLHLTRMGVRFYESTLPELVTQVARLADALERIADSHVRVGAPQPKLENEHEPEDRDQARDQDLQPPHA